MFCQKNHRFFVKNEQKTEEKIMEKPVEETKGTLVFWEFFKNQGTAPWFCDIMSAGRGSAI